LRSLTGNNIINKLDYFNTNDELLNLYRLYNTEALILSMFGFPSSADPTGTYSFRGLKQG